MSDWSDFSLFGGDTSDYGSSWDFGGGYDFGNEFAPAFDTSWLSSYVAPPPMPAYTGTSDVLGSRGMYTPGGMADPSATFNAGQMADPSASIASAGGGGISGYLSSLFGGGGTGVGGGSVGGVGGGVGGGGTNPLIGGLLGALGPAASLIGALASGGVTGTSQPKIPTNAMAQLNAGANALSPFATGASPLQQQQASLLNAIASGQGLAQPYAQAIERAFEPQLGSLYEQATNAGRARGFYDAPATSPAGGAVLGPGLANLQGQIAAAKIAQMNALPGLFQQPINTQAMAGGQWANSMLDAAQRQIGRQQSVPTGTLVGQGLSGMLGAGSAGYNAFQQASLQQQANQQQQLQNSLLSALKYPGYGA